MDTPARLTIRGSSAVAEAAYDADRRILHVHYGEGDRYAYSGVPAELYEALVRTYREGGSTGLFINTQVKPHYPYEVEVRRRRFPPSDT